MGNYNPITFLVGVVRDLTGAHRNAYLMAGAASFGGMLFGWDTGLIGGVTSMKSFKLSFDLQNQSTDEYADTTGNIVSTLQAGCFFGAMSSIYLSAKFGRKPAMWVAVVIFLAGSIMQTCAGLGTTSLGLVYGGRAVGGFGVGLVSAVVPTYIAESAPRQIRGRCVAAYQFFNVTGIALSYWINYGLSKHKAPTDPSMWRTSFALQVIPGILLAISLTFFYESPRWLVENGRADEARIALAWLRRSHVDDPVVVATLEEILIDYRERPKLSLFQQAKFACSSRTMFYRASIGPIMMFWQQATGTNSINYYAPQIFAQLGIANAGLFATGVYGIVKMVSTGTSLAIAVEQAGRKRCLIFGGLFQAACFYWIGIYQAVHQSNPVDAWSYTAIVAVYFYAIGYSFGWGTIPWALATEVVPTHIRAFTMGISLMTQWLFNYVVAQATPRMLARIPNGGTFLIFAAFLILMVLHVILFIPETRGVPLEEMGALFDGGRGAIFHRSLRHLRKPPKPASDRALIEHVEAVINKPLVDPAFATPSIDGDAKVGVDERREHVVLTDTGTASKEDTTLEDGERRTETE